MARQSEPEMLPKRTNKCDKPVNQPKTYCFDEATNSPAEMTLKEMYGTWLRELKF